MSKGVESFGLTTPKKRWISASFLYVMV